MEETDIKVYSYRWVVLAAFALINLTIQVLWICYAAITGPAAEHFNASDMQIGMLAMSFMIVYIPFAIPASWVIDRFGFRKGVGLGAVLMGVFGLARGLFGNDYLTVLVLTCGIALAQPLLLNAFTTLAAKWFPINERATVSGLAVAANFIGTAMGLMLTPWLVGKYDIGGMQMIYGAAAAISAAIFVVLVKEAPPTPPSPPGFEERALMFDGLKSMLRQRDFIIVMIVFFVGMGVFNGLASWIEVIVRPKDMSADQAGMLGGMLLIGGILGAFVMSTISDHYRRRKPFLLVGMILCIPGMLGFTFFSGYHAMLASIFALGFFMMGLAPVGIQYGAEITYPAPEGTSNGLLQLAGQVSVVFIYAMEAMNDAFGSFTFPLVLAAVLLGINCVLISIVKESELIEEESAPSRPGRST